MREEHKFHLKNVHKRLIESDEVRKSMLGNNTEEGKRYVFDQEFGKVSLDYVNDHFDFYKAVNEGPQKRFVMDLLYRIIKDFYDKNTEPKPYPTDQGGTHNLAAVPPGEQV